jgi:hypothetical protein
MLGPHEDWPFTSAPMFARYHTASDPVFELHVMISLINGGELHLQPQQHLGVGELPFRRLLFAKYYGSTDPEHPFGHHPVDSRANFQRRMKLALENTVRAFEVHTGERVRAARVEVRRFDAGGVIVRPILEYQVHSRSLRPLWPPGED